MATSTLGNGTLVLAGTTSGATTVTATAVAGTTTLTLPAATDTLVGKATTDTLTNKTLTGAAMNGTVGATTPSTGAFTTLSASGQGAINSAIATNSTFQVAGTYAGTGGLFDGGLFVNVDGGTMGVNRTISQSYFGYGADNAASTITTAASGTNDISTITVFPYAITSGGATLTNSTTLAINDAPNLGTNKRALWVKAGLSQLDGGLTVTGLTDISAATSGQIKFPATQNASSNANTLDDYEEGTFTPVMNFGGAAAFSSGTAQGKYTKIGNVVNFQINFTGYVKTANTGASQITGMPFSASDLQKIYMVQGDSLTYTSGAFLFCFNAGAGATLDPYQQAAGTASQFTNSSFNNGGSFRVTGSYFIS